MDEDTDTTDQMLDGNWLPIEGIEPWIMEYVNSLKTKNENVRDTIS